MISAPSVSVILPVCTAEKTLSVAVKSILNQVYSDWELLLIENGSEDETLNLCKSISLSDSRIHTYSLPEKGISRALNHGLFMAKAPFIARMDADDYSFPDRLQKQYTFLKENPEYGLVSGLVVYDTNIEKSGGYSFYVDQINSWKTPEQITKYRFVESPFAHPSVMFRKSLIECYGPYSDDSVPEDYELWLRWAEKNIKMAKINEPVIQWKDSSDRLSRTNSSYSQVAFDEVRYRYLANWLTENVEKEKPIYIWGGGKLAKQKVKVLQSYIPIKIQGVIDVKNIEPKSTTHIHYTEIPSPGHIFIISMVSNRGKYAEIENYLENKGYKVGKDFVLAG